MEGSHVVGLVSQQTLAGLERAPMVARFEQLERLQLSRTENLNSDVLCAVGSLKRLQSLDLQWCKGVDDEGIAALARTSGRHRRNPARR